LILLGLDLILGRRSAVGMVASALIALAFVVALIALLLLAPNIPALTAMTSVARLQTQNIQAPLDETSTANLRIDWSSGENSLGAAPAGSENLIEGRVTYSGELIFDVNSRDKHADITLDRRGSPGDFFAFNWGDMDWSLSLHPSVVYDLTLDAGSGAHDFNLRELQLSNLNLDGGSGSVHLALPPGNYPGFFDGGSGSITISLPEGSAVRIDLEGGSGSFNPDASLELVSGDRDGDGTWETAGFGQAGQRITLEIDQGSGSINIQNP
jgi:hypothetical protein